MSGKVDFQESHPRRKEAKQRLDEPERPRPACLLREEENPETDIETEAGERGEATLIS